MTLATIGPMSRKRAQIMPSSMEAEKAFSSSSARPGSAKTASGPGRWPKARKTIGMSGRLCAAVSPLRKTLRKACTVKGTRSWRITPSAVVIVVQASVTMPAMTFQTTRLTVRCGKYSLRLSPSSRA